MEKVDYNKAIINFEKEAHNRTNFSYDPVSNKSYDVSKMVFNQEGILKVKANGRWEII